MDYTSRKAVIFGCQGFSLTDTEREFFTQTRPLGFILFDRNIRDPHQIKQLVKDLKVCVGDNNAPVLVDQEGGRVHRLWEPFFNTLPWGEHYGNLYGAKYSNEMGVRQGPDAAQEELAKYTRIMAQDLSSVGINTNCWPCLDVARPETDIVLKKRCFSLDVTAVTDLGQTGVAAALKNGIMPVIKHFPGYGRTTVDPHAKLPVINESLDVLKETDFAPFMAIKEPVWGMTAHIIVRALDDQLPITLSPKGIAYIRGEMGFDGFLIPDDISMGALKSFGKITDIEGRTIEIKNDGVKSGAAHLADVSVQLLNAGCDAVLHCNGCMDEMRAIAAAIPAMSAVSIKRLKTGQAALMDKGN
ncbi:MAG: hypothetical protein LBU87_02695 [Lactobacillales bacterium]|jgi:beta-N-acetylhexosaminidase|nr:hypothetical protein [Lactobacillales bacterium]